MNLQLSLPERPGLLHAIPVCDLFVVMWLLFFFGTALFRQSGVAVDLPPSRFQLERFQDTHVVTLGPGEAAPRLHFGRDAVTLEGLQQRLGELRSHGAQASSVVLLKTDAGTPVGVERQVSDMVLGMGFRLALLGKDTEAPAQPEPAK